MTGFSNPYDCYGQPFDGSVDDSNNTTDFDFNNMDMSMDIYANMSTGYEPSAMQFGTGDIQTGGLVQPYPAHLLPQQSAFRAFGDGFDNNFALLPQDPIRTLAAAPAVVAESSADAQRNAQLAQAMEEGPVEKPMLGPMSNKITLRDRPKPGRKAMPADEASDRRRTQNRNAQRNFRDKRQQKVAELNEEIARLIAERKDMIVKQSMELQDEKKRHAQTERNFLAEIETLRASNAQLTAELSRRDSTFTGPKLPAIASQPHDRQQEIAIPTPPEDNWNEIDMADVWNRSKPTHQAEPLYSYDMDTDPTDSGCGFCTDETNCACKASVVSAPPKQTSSGPGTCDSCQRDPARAAACRSLADKTKPSSTTTSVTANKKTMSCGQFIDKFNNDHGRMPSIAELFGPLHSFPARNGFNVDEQEAAKVLQGMSVNPAIRH